MEWISITIDELSDGHWLVTHFFNAFGKTTEICDTREEAIETAKECLTSDNSLTISPKEVFNDES